MNLPERYGKSDSVSKAFRRWCQKGLWKSWFEKVASKQPKGVAIAMIDATHIKVHQDATRQSLDSDTECFGKTKGGHNTKLNAVVNREGKAVSLLLMPGNRHEVTTACECLGIHAEAIVLADKGYDSDELRDFIFAMDGVPMIPPKSNRKTKVFYDKEIGKQRRMVENFFSRIKRFRRVGTRYDKLSSSFMGFVFLATISDWCRN